MRKPTFFAMLLAGCGTASPPPSPPLSGSSPDVSCDASDLGAAAQAALDTIARPGAVVVIDLRSGSEVAAVERGDTLQASVSPGSTLKPIVALAALRAGAIVPDDALPCGGQWSAGDVTYTCFERHQPLDLTKALALSCNAYFYEATHRTGAEAVAAEFSTVGLSELAATVSTSRHFIVPALGHGDARVTPRALAHAYATMLRTKDPRLAPVHHGLVAAVTDGTATAAAAPDLAVAGKTGTAEDATGSHTWFVGYAPADDPRVLVLAYVRGEGNGGTTAAPVASRVLSAWSGLRCPT